MLEETKLINLKKTLMEFATLVESMVDLSITGLKTKNSLIGLKHTFEVENKSFVIFRTDESIAGSLL